MLNDELTDYRKEIDSIDREIVRLLGERMRVAGKIAGYKKKKGLPVLDSARETEKLSHLCSIADSEAKVCIKEVYELLFKLSRSYQEKVMADGLSDTEEV